MKLDNDIILNSIVNSINGFVFIADSSLDSFEVLPTENLIFGYTWSEIKPIKNKLPEFLFSEKDLFKIKEKIGLLSATTQKHQTIKIKNKNNTTELFEIKLSHIYSENNKYILGIVVNISAKEKKLSALTIKTNNLEQETERMLMMLKAANIGFFDINLKTGKIITNETYSTMLGYTPRNFHESYKQWTERLHPDEKDMVINELDKYTQKKNTDGYEFIFRQKSKAGKWIWILSKGKVIDCNTDGSVKRLLGINIDISNRVNQENELKIAKKQAEESDNLKSMFLKNVSHEIRTPMNAIIGFSNLVIKPGISQEKRTHYQNILQNSVNQLLGLINSIITISHLETNQLKINETIFNPQNLINELYNEYSNLLLLKEKKTLNLKTTISNIKIKIKTDYSILKHIFNELIDNALKFTNNGEVEFGYHLSSDCITFFINDTGIGIPQIRQEVIFKSFAHANDEVRQIFGGLGLGLSIVLGYLKVLKGKITVNSIINKGTCINFKFPISMTLPDDGSIAFERPNYNWSSKKIILISDSEFNTSFIEETALYTRVQIETIETIESIEYFLKTQNNEPDLIVIDCKTPNIENFNKIQQIKNDQPEIPLLLLTTLQLREDITKKIGIDSFLIKPFLENDFLHFLHKFLSTPT